MKLIDFLNLINTDERQNGTYTIYHAKSECGFTINISEWICDKDEVISFLSDVLAYKVASISLFNNALTIFIEDVV